MTTAAKLSFGSELWLAPHGTPLVKVAELLTLTPPRRSREMVPATSHDSPGGAEEVIPSGTYDPGNVQGQVHYIAGAAGDIAMVGYFVDATYVDWLIVAKSANDTEDMSGSGYIAEYGVDELPTDGKQTATFDIKVSGEISQGPSA